jgi:hypothetical protein
MSRKKKMKNTNGVELFLVLALPASFAHYLCIMIVPQKGATQLQTSLSLSLGSYLNPKVANPAIS